MGEIGDVTYPARVREGYAQDLLESLDVGGIQSRRFRIAVDYGYSAASFVLPLLTGPLDVEVVSAHEFSSAAAARGASIHESIGQTKRLVQAIGADLGAAFDRAAERLYVVDEMGREIPVESLLLLFLRLLGSNGRRGKVAVPVTVTRRVDELTAGTGLEVVRTEANLADLSRTACADGFVFAGAVGGGYLFPQFLPAYDAMASLCKLLELLAPLDEPLSQLVAALPQSTVVHRQLACPWALKGLVMRVLTERLRDRELDLTDGIKAFEERGWAQLLPDPDEPLLHVYAEGETREDSSELEHELRSLVEEIMQEQESPAGAQISS
jgi:mannose-1-phosphate guanylyltransferase/phosphomannomutase